MALLPWRKRAERTVQVELFVDRSGDRTFVAGIRFPRDTTLDSYKLFGLYFYEDGFFGVRNAKRRKLAKDAFPTLSHSTRRDIQRMVNTTPLRKMATRKLPQPSDNGIAPGCAPLRITERELEALNLSLKTELTHALLAPVE